MIKKNVTEMPENDLASAFQKDYAKEKWLKHHKLVSLCYEVTKNTLTLVEPDNSEVIFESDDCILSDITFQNSEAYSKSC